MEVRDTYAVPSESDSLQRFLNGESKVEESWDAWNNLIVEVTGRGVVVSRVRVITVPHSDYQRWLLTETSDNIEAGEDIRYLPRHLVSAEDVPADDFWLFDDETVCYNLIDREGAPAGAAITIDPRIVEYCQRAREHLWSLATPFIEYVSTESRLQ